VNDTLATEAEPVLFPAVVFPKPMVSLAVQSKKRGDEQKIAGAFAKLTDEDKTFIVNRDRQTGELVITG